MGKFICSNKYLQHNWIPCEKNTDWDICTECGVKRRFISEMGSSGYNEIINAFLANPINAFKNIGDKGEQAEELNSKMNAEAILKQLTPQQRKIAKLLERGYNQREIAEKLKISQQAVQQLLSRTRCKLSKKSSY